MQTAQNMIDSRRAAYHAASKHLFELEKYSGRLPAKPYCVDEFPGYVRPRKVTQAIKRNLIQHNHPQRVQVMMFDLDSERAAEAHDLAGVPAPSFICINPVNRHAHTFYALANPIYIGDGCNSKAKNLLEATQAGMFEKLQPYGADRGFVGSLAKNPYSKSWQTHVLNRELFTLGKLGKFCDVEKYLNPYNRRSKNNLTRDQAAAIGRNALMFYDLRQLCYAAYREAGYPRGDQWFHIVLEMAVRLNARIAVEFKKSELGFREVHSIARSIAHWVQRNFSETGFSRVQAKRGAKGGAGNTAEQQSDKGKASGAAKARKRAENAIQVQKMQAEGYSAGAIIEALNISRAQYYKLLKVTL